MFCVRIAEKSDIFLFLFNNYYYMILTHNYLFISAKGAKKYER
jgi:hypothetical protein